MIATYRKYCIDELRKHGITAGPNAEPLEDMEYFSLRSFLVKVQMQSNTEIKESKWF